LNNRVTLTKPGTYASQVKLLLKRNINLNKRRSEDL